MLRYFDKSLPTSNRQLIKYTNYEIMYRFNDLMRNYYDLQKFSSVFQIVIFIQ